MHRLLEKIRFSVWNFEDNCQRHLNFFLLWIVGLFLVTLVSFCVPILGMFTGLVWGDMCVLTLSMLLSFFLPARFFVVGTLSLFFAIHTFYYFLVRYPIVFGYVPNPMVKVYKKVDEISSVKLVGNIQPIVHSGGFYGQMKINSEQTWNMSGSASAPCAGLSYVDKVTILQQQNIYVKKNSDFSIRFEEKEYENFLTIYLSLYENDILVSSFHKSYPKEFCNERSSLGFKSFLTYPFQVSLVQSFIFGGSGVSLNNDINNFLNSSSVKKMRNTRDVLLKYNSYHKGNVKKNSELSFSGEEIQSLSLKEGNFFVEGNSSNKFSCVRSKFKVLNRFHYDYLMLEDKVLGYFPSSADCFERGFVFYSNSYKHNLEDGKQMISIKSFDGLGSLLSDVNVFLVGLPDGDVFIKYGSSKITKNNINFEFYLRQEIEEESEVDRYKWSLWEVEVNDLINTYSFDELN